MSSSEKTRREKTRINPTAESVYRYVIRYKRMNGGDSPTMREIMAGVGVPTTSMVAYYLESLEEAGKIVRSRRGQARRITIPGAEWRFDEVAAAEGMQNKCAVTVASGEN